MDWNSRYAVENRNLCECHGYPALQCPNPVVSGAAEAAMLPSSAEGDRHMGREIARHVRDNAAI